MKIITVMSIFLVVIAQCVYAQDEKTMFLKINHKYDNINIEEESYFDLDDEELVYDPICNINKIMFDLNDHIYFHFLKPISKYYGLIIPIHIRTGISNFIYNISMPTRFINCLLQGKWDSAQGEMARFIINSTFGIGGLLNLVSEYPELNPSVEDMGQTLGKYKIGNGFYIVWPILGPSTLRDSIGMIGDWFLNPINHISNDTDKKISMFSFERIHESESKINRYEEFKKTTFNPYEAFRDAYIQNRNNEVIQ